MTKKGSIKIANFLAPEAVCSFAWGWPYSENLLLGKMLIPVAVFILSDGIDSKTIRTRNKLI